MTMYIRILPILALRRKTFGIRRGGNRMPKENYENESWDEGAETHRSKTEEDEEEILEDDDSMTAAEMGFVKGCSMANKKDAGR